MSLSRRAGFGNFCFNLLSSFLSIVCILSCQAILFQILLYALFPRFLWSSLLPFPSYFKFHNLTYLGVDVPTDGITIPPQTALNYHNFNLHNSPYPISKNISQQLLDHSHPTHYLDHTMLFPAQPCLIRNSKFLRFTKIGLTQN